MEIDIVVALYTLILIFFFIFILFTNYVFNNIEQNEHFYTIKYFYGISYRRYIVERSFGKYRYFYYKNGEKYRLEMPDDMINTFTCYDLNCDKIEKLSLMNDRVIETITKKDITYKQNNMLYDCIINISLPLLLLYTTYTLPEFNNIFNCIITLISIILSFPIHKNMGRYLILNVKHNGFRRRVYITNS